MEKKSLEQVVAVILMGYAIGYVIYGAELVSWLTIDKGIGVLVANLFYLILSIPISFALEFFSEWLVKENKKGQNKNQKSYEKSFLVEMPD